MLDRTVMIVDDEFSVAEGVSKLIDWKQYGFRRILCCSTGEEALTQARKYHPDLVITDICMNGMNGTDLVKSLCEENLCSKYIIISAFAVFEYAQKVMNYGARHYLVKPISKIKLEMAVEEYFGKPLEEVEVDDTSYSMKITHREELFDEFTGFVSKHYNEPISISDLSENLHLNQSYTGQLFHNIMGKTFAVYLHEFRAEKAKQFIQSGKYSFSEIGIRVGYSNVAYFFKCFKQATGLTPSEFAEIQDTKNKI